MKMKLFGQEETVIGIVDVGNSSIGSSLVRLDRRGAPTILFSSRTQLKVQETRTSDLLLQEVLKQTPGVFERLHKAAALYTDTRGVVQPLKISHLLFLTAAPWVRVASIRTLRFARSSPFVATEELLERLLADEIRLEQRETEDGFSTIERSIVGLRLNGYTVTSLTPSPVTSAEATFFTASASTGLLKALEEGAEHAFPDIPHSFHSVPLAAYHGLATAYPSLLSYVVVNVTGEVTELLHVEDGAPAAFGTFPVGRNMLLRTLETNGLPPHEAISAVELARTETSQFNTLLSETLSYVGKEWRTKLRETLSELIPTGSFPSALFVIADTRVDDWFADIIATEEFLTVSRGGPTLARALTVSDLGKHVHLQAGEPDTLIYLAAMFADARFDARMTIDVLSTKIPTGMRSRATLKTS